MNKTCLLSGNFALDTIVTRDYSDGFVLMRLDGGEYRQGTWSVKEEVLTLKFDDGEVMKGTFCEEGLLLDYDGGFLLDFCYLTKPYEIDSEASP